MKRKFLLAGALAVLVLAGAGTAIAAFTAGVTPFLGAVWVQDSGTRPSPDTCTSGTAGCLYTAGAAEFDGAVDADSTLNVAGASTLTGAVTASSTLAVTGVATFTAGVDAPVLAAHLSEIHFCGNGPDGATATYISPSLPADMDTDNSFGGTACDAEDNTTESTADEVFHAGFAIDVVSMYCTGLCSGATAADDAVVYQLRDDTADVTGVTCTASAFGGDATPSQCQVTLSAPVTVAAGSTIAVEITATDDDCNDAGDDFECRVFYTISDT